MIPAVFTVADPIAPVVVLVGLFGSFFLSIWVAHVYIRTHRGLSYSQAFVHALVLLGTLGSVIMMIASGSLLRAIGILGAFSIIRFRTPIKDPKDMAFIMLVLGVGMAMGAQMYVLALFATIMLTMMIWFLALINFGSTRRHDFLVRLVIRDVEAQDVCETILKKNVQSLTLLTGHARNDGTHMEFSYGVQPKKDTSRASLLSLLSTGPGVISVDVFDAKHEVEF